MYDLEEQEKIDALKAWWKQYGKIVIAAAVVAIAALSGIQGWKYYQASQAKAASILYESLQDASQESDINRVRGAAGQIM
ncbi:MAG: tetratricopeptide repeat protein, partial [Candidatus Nanopelagicales bacterium]